MRCFHSLFWFLIWGNLVNAQSLHLNKTFKLTGRDYGWEIICKDKCVFSASFDYRSIKDSQVIYMTRSFYEINNLGDTFYINSLNPKLSSGTNILSYQDNCILVRYLDANAVSGNFTFGDLKTNKFRVQDGHQFWLRTIINPLFGTPSYYGSGIASNLLCTTGNSLILSTRELWPTPFTYPHPFVQEYDTSGNLVREADFLHPTNQVAEAVNASKLPNGDFIITVKETNINDQRFYVQWIDGATLTPYKKKYLPINRERDLRNRINVEVLKPGDKYLIYGNLSKPFISRQRDTLLYVTDSSLNINNPIWQLNSIDLKGAKALDDGNFMALRLDGFNLRIEKREPLNGNLIWGTTASLQTPGVSLAEYGSFDIDDSGNVYCINSVYSPGPYSYDITLTRVNNIGIKWDPWNPNPNGTVEERKKFTFYPYPNPTTGKLRLRGLKETEGVSLRLFNNQGQEVWKGSPTIEGEIDISNLPIGLYHLEALNAQGQRWSTRVVRE